MYDAVTNGSDTVPLPVKVATVPFDSFVSDGPGIAGVTVLEKPEVLTPTEVRAFTANKYAVPFASPVTVALVAVEASRVTIVYVEPPLLEYRTV